MKPVDLTSCHLRLGGFFVAAALLLSGAPVVAQEPEGGAADVSQTAAAAEASSPVEGSTGQSKDVATARSLAAVPRLPVINGVEITVRPPVRRAYMPRTRWQHMEGHALWTQAAMSALKTHGRPLIEMVPRDIANWCPAYPQNGDLKRKAFWVGYMSALAKHESTYKPWAVGGGGRWYGLLQILPATARGYKCNVGTGEALKNGAANLSCGVRIMAYTVKRDGVIHGRDSKWRGVSADWGPMRNARKRADMANWLKRQNYCKPVNATRPKARP